MNKFVKTFIHPSPRCKMRWIIVGIIVLFLLTAFYNFSESYNANLGKINDSVHSVSFLKSVTLPKVSFGNAIQDNFQLGLDLKGGTHLVYEADISKIPDSERTASLEGVRDVIERRINAFGVAEPVVQTVKVGSSHRVVVELAGVHEVSKAIKMIGETPLLEFKEEYGPNDQKPQPGLSEVQKKELESYNADAVKRANDVLKSALTPGSDFVSLAKSLSEDNETKEKGGDVGWISEKHLLYPQIKDVKVGEVKKEVFAEPNALSILKNVAFRESEKEVQANHILICYKGATRCEKETSKEDAKKKIDELKTRATAANFIALAKENSTEPGANTSGGDLGWFSKGAMVKSFEDVAFSIKKGEISQVVETQFGYHLIYKRDERPLKEYQVARIVVFKKTEQEFAKPSDQWKATGLTGEHLKRASVEFNSTTQFPEIGLEFNDEGKKLFADITTRNVQKVVAIFLDGQAISQPKVQQAITDGKAVIQGDFTLKDAKELAQRLNAGALPVPITLLSQQTVGASLGEESLQKSLTAGLLGFLLVALFMIFFYRLPGLLAVLALCVYTSLVLALFKVVPVTMSLAGIAGFILSIGMAVDANVLIFERMKEELRNGKQLDMSIRDGFKRAWTSIRDSNVSSLITCFVLFGFSASLIKGFALTLAIGIIMSMFSAIVITRVILRFVAGWRIRNSLWLFCGKKI